MNCTATAPVPTIKLCVPCLVTCARRTLYRDTCLPHKACTRTAKTTPYPPRTVTAFWLKNQDTARMLRRVTQPPHIAGPLAHIFGNVRLSHRAILIKFYLDNRNSVHLSGPAIARQTICPPADSRKICYYINNTAFYRDSPIAHQKIHVLTA